MKHEIFIKYASSLLKIYKTEYPQYHCQKEYCCGLCDRFFTCLLFLTDEIKMHVLNQQKEKDK